MIGVSRARTENGLEVLSRDRERVLCRAWRHGPHGGRTPILVVLPAAEQPAPSLLERLADEYALKDELDAAWAVRPLALERDHGRVMLVMEDPGGEPLDDLLAAPLDVRRLCFSRSASRRHS